jgi:hypothetical protein
LAGGALAALQAAGLPLSGLYGLLALGSLVMLMYIIRSWGADGALATNPSV